MPQPQLEPFKLRGLTLKMEVTEGVDSVPTPAANGIMLLDGSSGTEFDKVERNIDRPFFTNNPFAVANKRAFIEGMIEMFPPTTPGDAADGIPHVDPILRIAGMERVLVEADVGIPGSTRYNPISAAIPSASAYWWHVDAFRKVLGSRANITGMRMTIGEIPQLQARIQGFYDEVEKEALPTNIVLPTFIPDPLRSDNGETHISTVDGTTIDPELLLWGKSISIDFANSMGSKEYTSHKVSAISDRLATWSLRIARADLADFNPWAIRDAGLLIEARIRQLYAATDHFVEIGIRGQIESITETDIDSDLGWELSGPCIASSAGGDEMYVEFSEVLP